ncbi:MAG: DUF4830 domain-containing protein [Clostridia bacterium]|nr:DUF4830 domain-containing protein [Clostridia bacterium]
MFVYSVRAGTLKFVGVICVALVALITLIAFVPNIDGAIIDTDVGTATSGEQTVRYDKVKSAEDVAKFLAQFGWETTAQPVEVKEVVIPSEFDRVFTSYNEIQKQQGLDLSKYRRKTATRYTMEITNYGEYDGRVYANVIVYHNKVIGGDICSADMTGFMHGFDVK